MNGGVFIEFFETGILQPKYITEPGCNRVGKILIKQEGIFKVSMCFGKSEIKINAKYVDSDTNVSVDLVYGEVSIEIEPIINIKKYHIILCNDRSSSMSNKDMPPNDPEIREKHNNRVGAIYQCCKHIITSLLDTENIISCIAYNTQAEIIIESQAPSMDLMDRLINIGPSGGTSFVRGMEKVSEIVDRCNNDYEIICIFMSDGECEDKGSSDIANNIFNQRGCLVHTIGIGNKDHSVLKTISERGGGQFRKGDIDLNQLIDIYRSFLAPIVNVV